METNDGKDVWSEKLGFWLYWILLACLLVGAVVIAFTNHADGWLMAIGAIIGVIIIVMALLCTGRAADSMVMSIAVLLAFVVFFMSSWFMWSDPGALVTREGKERIVLYQGSGPLFFIPYTGKVYYLQNFTAKAEVFLLLDGEGEVRWEARAKLSLTADYDQSFALLREFRGVVAWKNAVQQLFQEETSRYVAEHVSSDQAVIPESFVFQLAEEGFTKLGFSPGEVAVQEISRFVYKGG